MVSTSSAPALDQSLADRLLAQAVIVRTLKLGLQRPETSGLAELRSALSDGSVERAARLLESEGREVLRTAVGSLSRKPIPAFERQQHEHERIFGHTLRGRVCPYECEYGRREVFQQAQELADLTGFYRAFGLTLSPQAHERADHIACQLDFLEFLVLKELHAVWREDSEMRQVTRQATRDLLARHLARFGRAFAVSLQRADAEGFYGAVGGLCEAFLETVCSEMGVTPGPPVLELCAEEPDDVPMACGSQDGLVQLGGADPGERS